MTMSKPLKFYKKEKQHFEQQGRQLKKQANWLSILRLVLFFLALPLFYFFIDQRVVFISLSLVLFISFVYLVLKYQSNKRKRKLTDHLIDINKVEINALNGDYQNLPEGSEFNDANHFFSNDIDMFGRGSFFQYLNRTGTSSGKAYLAELLLDNGIADIVSKQEVIRELSKKISWRQRFLALSKMVKVDLSHSAIVSWIKGHKSFLPAAMSFIPIVFSALSLVFIFLTTIEIISFYFLVIWFFLGLLITLPYIQKINRLYLKVSQIKETFRQYHVLLKEIEDVSLESRLALDQQNKIRSSSKKASLIFREFSKILDAFDQRNNMLFGVIGNAFFLWDLRQTSKIDQWISSYKHQVESWFEVIAYFDAQISLANYAYNHPHQNFPVIQKGKTILKAKGLGHPLLNEIQRVTNDFLINAQDFHIVTGANMAGKSTFLRTVSLSLVMANSGLPVCAESMYYSPIKLISSMRTSDSLADESSYFYAEIMRLRFIVDQIKTEDYFIILDEILKGTNSKDKAIGSRKFVEKLVNSGSTGIIATHDLSLCDIEDNYPQIKNEYFDALIKDEELFFDYKLKQGVCKNMNASFLLKKMEII